MLVTLLSFLFCCVEFIAEEDIGDVPAESERQRPRGMSWQQEEDDEDLERLINERYGPGSVSAQYDEAETTEVEQQALLPSVKDPKLWMVKCQVLELLLFTSYCWLSL